MKLTVLQYYRIKGDSIQLRGVLPDIPLPDAAAHLDASERAHPHAIPWHAIKPVPFTPWLHSWAVPRLRQNSLARQVPNVAFRNVKARTAFLQQQRDNTVEALNMTAWLQRREQDNAELAALKLDDSERFDVRPIDYMPALNVPQDTRTQKAEAWAKQLRKDPWLEEALWILNDMVRSQVPAKTPRPKD